jgi:hypothetical protein
LVPRRLRWVADPIVALVGGIDARLTFEGGVTDAAQLGVVVAKGT